MTPEAIHDVLREEIRKVNPQLSDDLKGDSHFQNDLKLDSLALVEFVARIEQDFGILIPDEDLPQFVTLDATASYLQTHLRT
jgi:acyl carrier protein